jgi:hypothetical protein
MQYVNLDIYNNGDANIPCSQEFKFPGGILHTDNSLQNKHTVTCLKASYDQSSIPMMFNSTDIEFSIRPAGDPTTVTSSFTFKKGYYYTISEILDQINGHISSIGQFEYDSISEKIKYKSAIDEATNPTEVLHLPYRLKKLFDGFDYDFVSSTNTYVILEKGTSFRYQEFSTIDRFYNRKSIRVLSSNLGQKTFITNDNLTGYDHSILLTDQILSTGRDRLYYIPTQYREISLENNNRIYSLRISVEVEFSDGSKMELQLSPGSYFSISLLFTPV